MTAQAYIVEVFAAGPHGGNPTPIAIDAVGMSDADMQNAARSYGLESAFVVPAPVGSDCDFTFRFWVPKGEMDMCGHATVGAVWLLNQLGKLPRDEVAILTLSGRIEAHIVGRSTVSERVEITQPQGRVEELPDSHSTESEILSALGITPDELAPFPIRNACTSRVKTLIPLKSTTVLDGLRPNFQQVEQMCERIGSIGLYPYAPCDIGPDVFDARQFPKSSGFPEDAATGVAATALAFGLLANGLVKADHRPIKVRQGRAMGRPSEITVRFRLDVAGQVNGCWIGGNVRFKEKGESVLLG
jgi:PhzF family phenazine biosynthesis protein